MKNYMTIPMKDLWKNISQFQLKLACFCFCYQYYGDVLGQNTKVLGILNGLNLIEDLLNIGKARWPIHLKALYLFCIGLYKINQLWSNVYL